VTGRAWALFAAVTVLWGVPYLFIRVAVEEVSPPVVVLARTLLAAALLAPFALAGGSLAALRGRRRELALLALVEIAVPFTLISAGEVHVTSSLAAILIALEPLMVVTIGAVAGLGERVDGRALAGLVLGLAGVAALVGIDVGGDGDRLGGVAMIVAATACYAVGVLWVRVRFAGAPPVGLATVTVAWAAAWTAPAALLTLPGEVPSAGTLGSLAVLGVGCTALALALFFRLIAEAGPVRAVLITYTAPVVAVAAGVAVLDEPLSAGMLVGVVLIAAGSWLASARRPEAAPPPEAPGAGGAVATPGRR